MSPPNASTLSLHRSPVLHAGTAAPRNEPHTPLSRFTPGAVPPVPRGTAITLRGLGKAFGTRQVLQGITLQIEPGEFIAIVGRSGCGKSTLLRLVAGLDQASAGELLLDGQPLTERREDTRIMFQDARLLP